MADLQEGEMAPDFELPAGTGATVRLSALRGGKVVVYFYPKDNTEACTLEAREFSALKHEFERAGSTVLGISPDSVAKHVNFTRKQELTVDLLSDAELKVANAYGVWVEKSMYGRSYMGVERATFLIDEHGRIVRVWRKVKAPGHAAAVLDAVRATA